jgi:hypothetical protein
MNRLSPTCTLARRAALLGALFAAPLLAGCGANFTRSTACDGNNFDRVTLQPGCSATCTQEPCSVYFRMPAGQGKLLVRGRAVDIGEYPAGETAFLGSFWHGSHIFTVEGVDVPPAYLTVGGGVGSSMGIGF